MSDKEKIKIIDNMIIKETFNNNNTCQKRYRKTNFYKRCN